MIIRKTLTIALSALALTSAAVPVIASSSTAIVPPPTPPEASTPVVVTPFSQLLKASNTAVKTSVVANPTFAGVKPIVLAQCSADLTLTGGVASPALCNVANSVGLSGGLFSAANGSVATTAMTLVTGQMDPTPLAAPIPGATCPPSPAAYLAGISFCVVIAADLSTIAGPTPVLVSKRVYYNFTSLSATSGPAGSVVTATAVRFGSGSAPETVVATINGIVVGSGVASAAGKAVFPVTIPAGWPAFPGQNLSIVFTGQKTGAVNKVAFTVTP